MTHAADWVAVEDALHAEVVRLSGYAGDRVIWDNQGAPRPELPFITLRLDGFDDPGWAGELTVTDATDPEPGADILLGRRVHLEGTLTITAFADPRTGAGSARAVLTRIRAGLNLDSTTENLDTSGVSIFGLGVVQDATVLVETEYESRAIMNARLRVSDGAEDLTTWIESVETTPTFEE